MFNVTKEMELKFKILSLKDKLRQTDYLAIKYSEGLIPPAEYMQIKEQRQAWRDEINVLEAKIKVLRGE